MATVPQPTQPQTQQVGLNPTAEQAKQALARIRETYNNSNQTTKTNTLLLGVAGSGKTRSALTAVGPVLIDRFDPHAPLVLNKDIQSGRIIVEDFSLKDPANPVEWEHWLRRMAERERDGVFNYIGTYYLDSLTFWLEAGMLQIARQDKNRVSRAPELQDYNLMGVWLRNNLKKITALPCNVVVTGHLERETEEVSGKVDVSINIYKKMRPYIPSMFGEIYIAEARSSSKGTTWTFRTRTDGMYKCRTGIGADVFDEFEPPDFKHLFKKAGLPCEDKEI